MEHGGRAHGAEHLLLSSLTSAPTLWAHGAEAGPVAVLVLEPLNGCSYCHTAQPWASRCGARCF